VIDAERKLSRDAMPSQRVLGRVIRWRVDTDDETSVPALPIDGVLDLHAFRPEEVAQLVQDYLDECQRTGILAIRIIHGKGIGTLRRTVHAGLERRRDVVAFGLAPPERGGWGATLVTLRACPVPEQVGKIDGGSE
jgi:hypothetical protein